MAGSGLGRPDEGGKVGGLLLSHCSGGPVWARFPATAAHSGGGVLPAVVVGDKVYAGEVVAWPAAIWFVRTEGEKIVARCCKVVWADSSGPLSGDLQLLRRWLLVVAC